ncbi:4-alpha-glucanotransferase [Botryobacter ruber]|uniref:4-alpha-glucanotransferase n=1 Tax=Botryobacter ruber TaxID=2171629 RepID=UPI000E0BAE0E|nr:4-alpha-glucanotransferase [Botryobacter ruber]
MIIPKRSSGILLHITSLPSPYGIGDLGPEAYKFADLLEEAGQRYWQILPLNPTEVGSGSSPYSSHSAFAGNPLLLSPDLLLKEELVKEEDLAQRPHFPDDKVDFPAVTDFKRNIWFKAYATFKSRPNEELRQAFRAFREKHWSWLEDYSQFVVFKNHFEQKSWVEWPGELKQRHKGAMHALAQELENDIEREQFLQFLFYRQWEKLKAYCHLKDITFIGDMPFYVSHDSADVWAHPQLFKLDKEGMPEAVSGVPPDYFSETGQLWGSPVYDWKALERREYDWWIDRVLHNLQLFGLLRLDHFRAFSAYWEIPAGEKTAMNGKWVQSPGKELLTIIKNKCPDMPIIAEDLGEIDQPVRDLMQEFGLPGMRVLLFAFGDDLPHSIYAPHHHIQNSIVYTGTHDNSTVRAWYENESGAESQARLREYSHTSLTKENAHEVMGRLAYMSVAQLAVLPIQDVLGLGAESIMNKPSTTENNWTWRLKPHYFEKKDAQKLYKIVKLYGR